ncbi:MAG: aminoacyl-tRNA hydrolase [Betaproteobacteria bacterium]|nr:aminoacyl-tRNA hydrolase [Betaproteobacteria bacterium]
MSGIRLIVGLGNPGREYSQTRHNAGFRWVEAFADSLGASWAKESKFSGHVARARVGGGDFFLLKADTFYNLTGKAVQALAQFYRIPVEQILAVHDELDLPPGGAKLKQGGGTAGNNGLKSMQAQLANANFWRLRIGIGHPREFAAKFGADAPEVVDYVLHAPTKDEAESIDEVFKKTIDLAPLLVSGEMERAMMQLHSKQAKQNGPAEPKAKEAKK